VGKGATEVVKDHTVATKMVPLRKDRLATKAVTIVVKKAATTVGKKVKVAAAKREVSEMNRTRNLFSTPKTQSLACQLIV
jgi:hypothetical protein